MRIGVDARVLTMPESRGIANYLLEILRIWPNKDDDFVLFIENGEVIQSLESSARFQTVLVPEPPGSRFKVWHWVAMPREIRKHKLDVMWCPANIPIPYCQCRQILTVHDTLLQEKFRKHKIIDRIYYRKLIPIWINKFVAQVITVSSFSKERITQLIGYDENKINVILNGLPTVYHSEDPIAIIDKLGVNIKEPYIYALGAESSWKNTERLIQSFCLVNELNKKLVLVVSGIQGSVLQKYMSLVNELGMANNIIILGFVDNRVRNALYQKAEAFVYPSLFEGFGFPPLEAMSLGCPVIASSSASIPEVVGEAAYLVDCTDKNAIARAIFKVTENINLRRELVGKGKSNICRFDWRLSAEKHKELLIG